MSAPAARLQAQPKAPPYSIEAEQSVLGGLMLDNRAWNELSDRLSAEDFYRGDHQLIYRAVCELVGTGRPCDFVTLSEHLKARGQLDEAGGLAYLGSLANDTPSAANVLAYADIVRERAVLRGLVAAGGDIAELGFRADGRSYAELLDLAEQKVFALRSRAEHARSSYHAMPELMQKLEEKIEFLRSNPTGLAGLSTGFVDLDAKTTGLHPGDLVILAGRPSMGKCLSHDAELVLDDGSIATIEDVCRRRDARVGTLRADLRLDRALPSDYVDDGRKPVFEVATRLGRRVETTLPHPFLTVEGWKPLAKLRVGDHVAVPRCLSVFGQDAMRECEIRLLAYLIGDGGLTGTSPRFTTTNPLIERDFIAAVAEFGGCVCTPYRSTARAPSFAVVADAQQVALRRERTAELIDGALARSQQSARAVAAAVGVSPASLTHWRRGKTVPDAARFERLCRVLGIDAADRPAGDRHNAPNAVTQWLRDLGLDGKDAGAKSVPAPVFRLPRQQLALFLRHLFATDGWASVYASGQAQIGYATISERLARQVTHLLLRFGVIAKLRLRWVRYREARRPAWQVDVSDAPSMRRFIDEIGIFGKDAAVSRVRAALDAGRVQTNADLVPAAVWKRIERAKGAMSWAELARRAGVADSNVHAHRRAISRDRLARFAMVLGDPQLAALAGSDVYWDRIESITPLGEKQVYDLTIPGTHNFIANDVCVHNTSFALNVAEHVVLYEKKPAAVFSMEMPAEQLALRILSSFARIPMGRLRGGDLDDRDWDRLVSQGGLIREAPLYIDETGALSPLELRARARRIKARHGLGLIVVDYIQLMQVPGTKENRTNEISEISRSLKALAKELEVPVIALSQLNRGVEQRDNKRPRMADLRESGGIEQDADVVVFIYRDEVYNRESPDAGTAEIIIAKQRNGPLGVVKTAFLGEFTRFDNLAQGYADD